jgi:LacI family transcriptional regulator
MKRKVSLKDIAQKVGVSIALVSYVLNNKKEGRINKDVAIKIKDTAKALNYRTNQIAKSLKTSKTFTIGLIVSDIANPFSSSLARIIEDEADKKGYTVIFGSSDEDAQKSQKLIDTFLNRQVDGLIIAPVDDSIEQIQYLEKEGIPFVLIDRYFPELKTNYVAIDNFKAAHQATNCLINSSYKRIGLITYQSKLDNLIERKKGYLAALKEQQIEIKKNWIREVCYNNATEGVEQAMNSLLSLREPVDAILFASNALTTDGLRYINRHNLKIPEELGIVSFDESDALDLFRPTLTYIKQPLQEMGQTATKILLENIDRNNKISQIKMDGELIIRKSSLPVAMHA